MAYSTANPPRLVASALDGSTPQIWAYTSADAGAVVSGAGYFTGAVNIGMRVGDTIIVADTSNAYAVSVHTISGISSGGAATAGRATIMATEADVGITGGTGTIYKTSVNRDGGIITTRIMIDLTGLNSGASAGDIIGVNGAGVAHIGRITAARNGTILMAKIECYETPAGGDDDIDVYAADEATGVEDVAISTLTETQLVNAGAHALGTVDDFTALPAAGQYLYLVNQGTGNATYTAGKFLITLWGY